MINTKKWAVVKLNPTIDPEGLPTRKVSDVIQELKKDGYLVINQIKSI